MVHATVIFHDLRRDHKGYKWIRASKLAHAFHCFWQGRLAGWGAKGNKPWLSNCFEETEDRNAADKHDGNQYNKYKDDQGGV